VSRHVFLTVGANELPVLAASEVLFDLGHRRFSFIASRETSDEAERIRKVLTRRRSGIDFVPVEPLASPFDFVWIREAVSAAFDSAAEPLHVHYSGGTMPMSVVAAQEGRRRNAELSYLDKDEHKLRVNDQVVCRDCRNAWKKPDIQDLAELHGLEVTAVGPDSPLASELKDVLGRRSKRNWRVYGEVSVAGRRWFDAVVLLGYQMIAFSCETSPKRSAVKLRTFQTMHSARRLGGDAASSILIAPQFENLHNLKADIEYDTGVPMAVDCWCGTGAKYDRQFPYVLSRLRW
jgi:hypothetical protein